MDDAVDYCRQIEAYLCKKNEGHLIRIVGPGFEQVRDWAEQGIPLKVAFRGIDRTCDRHTAKGGRRRPLRIEFCAADVLEAFDDWRRAIGVGANRVGEAPPTAKSSLAAHIERSVARLVALRSHPLGPMFDTLIASTVAALDELVTTARQSRGDARALIIGQLAILDTAMMRAARDGVDAAAAAALRTEVDAELAPFSSRMTEDALRRAAGLAYDRLLRESLHLPVIAYE